MDTRELIIYYAVKYKSNFEKITRAIALREPGGAIAVKNTVAEETNGEKGIKVLTALDYEYPAYLQNENKPDLVMFYRGNTELLKNQELNLSLIVSDGSVREFSDSKITELLLHLVNSGKNLVVLGHTKITQPLKEIVVRALLMGVKVIFIADSSVYKGDIEEKNMDYLVNSIIERKGLVISLFSTEFKGATEQTSKQSGEFMLKICKEIVLGNVNAGDEIGVGLVETALETHKTVTGFKTGYENSLNDILINKDIITEFKGEDE